MSVMDHQLQEETNKYCPLFKDLHAKCQAGASPKEHYSPFITIVFFISYDSFKMQKFVGDLQLESRAEVAHACESQQLQPWRLSA